MLAFIVKIVLSVGNVGGPEGKAKKILHGRLVKEKHYFYYIVMIA